MPNKLIYLNGFDYLPNNLQLGNADLTAFLNADGYYSTSICGTIPGFLGGDTTAFQPAPGTQAHHSLRNTYSGGAVGGLRFNWIQNNDQPGIYLYNSVENTTPLRITFGDNGQVTVSIGGLTLKSIAAAFLIGTWFYCQFKWLDNFFELKINGDTYIQSTSTSIDLLPFDTYVYDQADVGNSARAAWDDVYLLDPSAEDDVDYLGNILVPCNLPIANGDHVGLTPVGVSENWEAGVDWQLNNTTYDWTSTVGEYDLYQMAAGAPSRAIFGIQMKGAFTQDNGIQLYGKNQLKIDGTLYAGSEKGLNQINYGTIDDYFDKNPSTGLDWTTADLAVMQVGPLLSRSD